MSFASPQVPTVLTVAETLPRVGTREYGATYTNDDNTVSLRANHVPAKSNSGQTKRTLELSYTKVAANPLLDGVNETKTFRFFLNAVEPAQGFSIADKKDISQALMTLVNASSGALLVQWLGGES